ncbi:hypothetical protein AgCh_009952 [Apium graveolens]
MGRDRRKANMNSLSFINFILCLGSSEFTISVWIGGVSSLTGGGGNDGGGVGSGSGSGSGSCIDKKTPTPVDIPSATALFVGRNRKYNRDLPQMLKCILAPDEDNPPNYRIRDPKRISAKCEIISPDEDNPSNAVTH